MKTKTLSMILAIAMLLCGCRTAPAQSVPAAPVPEVSGLSSAVTEEKPPIEDIASVEEEQPKKPETVDEASQQTAVSQKGEHVRKLQSCVETIPFSWDNIKTKRFEAAADNGISVYALDGRIIAWKNKSDKAYVIGTYATGKDAGKYNGFYIKVANDKMLYIDGFNTVVYDTDTFEILEGKFDLGAENTRFDLEFIGFDYDESLELYVIYYNTYPDNKGFYDRIEAKIFDLQGDFIAEYGINFKINLDDLFEISFKDKVLRLFVREYYYIDSNEYYITLDFNSGDTGIKEVYSYKDYNGIITMLQHEISKPENGKKKVTVNSIWIEDGDEYTATACIEADESMENVMFYGLNDRINLDKENRRQTVKGFWFTIDFDYISGTGKTSIGPNVDVMEKIDRYVKSDNGRYAMFSLGNAGTDKDWREEYMVSVDYASQKIYQLGWLESWAAYGVITDDEQLIYDNTCTMPIFGGEKRYIVDYEAAEKDAVEQLGMEEVIINDFTYDHGKNLIVLTMFENAYAYTSDIKSGLKQEEYTLAIGEALKPHYPNYFLAIYDMDGNFVKYKLTDSPVYEMGKHGGEYAAFPVSDGKTAGGLDYLNDYPRYIMDGSTAYWQPLEKADKNIVKWRSFETGKVGEIQVPDEWDELVYAFDGCMIFRNISDGSCYKSDMRGRLLDSFTCEAVAGMNGIKWYPLSDFSTVAYVQEGFYDEKLCLWNRSGETVKLEGNSIYRFIPQPIKNNKMLVKNYSEVMVRYREEIISVVDLENRDILDTLKEIADNSAGMLQAREGYNAPYDYEFMAKYGTSRVKRYITNDHSDICAMVDYIYIDDRTYVGLYRFADQQILLLPYESEKYINDNQYFINGNMLCYLASDENGVHYRTLDLITNEQKSILTNLPTDYDDLRVVTVTDSGKVIIALQTNGEWKIFARNAKI